MEYVGLVLGIFIAAIGLFIVGKYFYNRGWEQGSKDAYHDLWKIDDQVREYHNNPPKE